eukprot:UN00574
MFSTFAKHTFAKPQLLNTGVSRFFATTAKTDKKKHGFYQFFNNATYTRVGRAWSVHELRLKSPQDLEKLWFVLLKERNALATYEHYCKQNRTVMKNAERITKCKESMKAIKVVLGERRHAYKEVIGDREFLDKRTAVRAQRRLEKHAERMDTKPKKTPNQINHVTVQAKKWRRKTMGSSLTPSILKAAV